jgi:hypothetical protein
MHNPSFASGRPQRKNILLQNMARSRCRWLTFPQPLESCGAARRRGGPLAPLTLPLTLQVALGWSNSHLYEIRAKDVGRGIPDPDWLEQVRHFPIQAGLNEAAIAASSAS